MWRGLKEGTQELCIPLCVYTQYILFKCFDKFIELKILYFKIKHFKNILR